ncbi:MAG TPA: hypothetical protein GXX25_05045 [Desulfotomaculum sp.]|nr:hypothetical protein [Desulfotomaculum sp.]
MIKTRNIFQKGKVNKFLSSYFPPPFKVSRSTTQNRPQEISNTHLGRERGPDQ